MKETKDILKEFIASIAMSKGDIAKLLNKTRDTLHRYETGKAPVNPNDLRFAIHNHIEKLQSLLEELEKTAPNPLMK